MNIESFREYCLEKPAATEGTPFGPDDVVFKVEGKMFDFVEEVFRFRAGLPVFMISKDLLIQNKRAVGRPQDLADLDALS